MMSHQTTEQKVFQGKSRADCDPPKTFGWPELARIDIYDRDNSDPMEAVAQVLDFYREEA